MATSCARASGLMAFTESSLKTFLRAVWNPMGLGVGVARRRLELLEVLMFTQHSPLQPSTRGILGNVVPGRTIGSGMSASVLGQAGACRIMELGGRVDPRVRPKPDFWARRGESLLGLLGGEERRLSDLSWMRLMGEVDMVSEEQVCYLVCNQFP